MTNPTYFTVVADYKAVVIDDAIDVDPDPQTVPISATVTFRPVLRDGDAILATDAAPRPTGFLAAPIVAKLNTSGRLVLRDAPDGTRENATNFAALPGTGNTSKYYVALDTGLHYRWDGTEYVEIPSYQPVRLLADTPLLELSSPLFYTVTFSNVVYGGRVSKLNGFTFQAPTSDIPGGLNLIEVMRQPGQPASGVTKIAPGAVRTEDGDLIFSFNGVDIPDPIPVGDIGYTINSETITDSTVIGRSVLTSGSAAAARTAIDAVSPSYVNQQITDADIPGQVVAAIAADETVVAAAEAAVDTAVEGLELVQTDDPRIPQEAEALDSVWRFAIADEEDRLAVGIDADGATFLKLRPDVEVAGAGSQTAALDVHYAIADEGDRMALYIDSSGRVVIPNLSSPSVVSDVTSGPDIVCIGDSLTAGTTVPDPAVLYGYPGALQGLVPSGVTVHNCGIGGENSTEIAARMNATPIYVTPVGGTLPASGAVALTVEPINGVGISHFIPSFATTWLDSSLAGVPGGLSITDGVYYFTRAAAGSAVVFNEPQPVINNFTLARRDDIHIIWVGQNNTKDAAGLERARTDAAAIIQEMTRAVKRWLVMSLPGNVTAITWDQDADDALWFERFGDRFLSPRKMLVEYGLTEMGITPTEQDLEDIEAGVIPSSLREDDVHCNADGYTAVARFIYRRLVQKGWI